MYRFLYGEDVMAHVCVHWCVCVCVCTCLWWTKVSLRHCSSGAIHLGLETGLSQRLADSLSG